MTDNYYSPVAFINSIGEKTLTYYFKVRRNACARRGGWRSRSFPSKFFPPFVFTYLSFLSFISRFTSHDLPQKSDETSKRITNRETFVLAT